VPADTRLRPLDGRGLIRELDAILAVYAAAMGIPAQQLPGRRMMMERHASYPAFRGLAAVTNADGPAEHGTIIGIGYGFRGEAGQWWHDMVTSAITAAGGRGTASAWMDDSFEVGELHVHPDHQGRGIGRRLLLSLASGRPERTAVLSTLDAESRARRLYRSAGFTDLLTGFRFPGGDEPYAVMGAPLPLRPGPGRSG
jgi:ribosomal protein S18 acetylase RimI-like enzyme